MTSELDFLTNNKNNIYKLLEDLSIIDNLGDRFDSIQTIDWQLIDTARNVTFKQSLLFHLQQTETEYVTDLCQLHDLILPRLHNWLENDNGTNLFKEKSLVELNKAARLLKQVTTVHLTFSKSLDIRMKMWGPTQFISDVLGTLNFQLYDSYLDQFEHVVIVLDQLYAIPSFSKFINSSQDIKELHYYFRLPLTRIPFYLNTMRQLVEFSDSSHPDYLSLNYMIQQTETLTITWEDRITNCLSHLGVLESILQVHNTPIKVTKDRRLLLRSDMIKVDLDDLSLTNDRRMYFLYNDCLIYCKKKHGNNNNNSNNNNNKKDPRSSLPVNWEYKGTLGLFGAEVRILAPSVLAKMVEIKKPLFRIGKKSSASETESVTEAFGFEVISVDSNIDAMSPMHQNYQVAMAGAANPILRRHMIRASSMEEQTVWIETLRKTIATFNK